MKLILVFLVFSLNVVCNAQDERFYRDIFNGQLYEGVKPLHYKTEAISPKYVIDLNSDGRKDYFQTIKRDGIDFIRIVDPFGKVVLEKALITKGDDSKIFKAHLKAVNKNTNVLILHYYEGHNESATFEGSGRLYFVTFPKNKLEQAVLNKGPYFWHERERAGGKMYYNRRYSVNVIDYNGDGNKEISVSFNRSQHLYMYESEGNWKSL